MALNLKDYQLDAVKRMKNGCILCGGVGTGKSRTALSYYYIQQGGSWSFLESDKYVPMQNAAIEKLYIITTARKRDTLDWQAEMTPFIFDPEQVVVDSWNNIKKYVNVSGAFFIFDEQRVVGKGAWVKSFLKITAENHWILLSATPGDTWMDYIPVFLANGFYRNRTEFNRDHVIFSRFAKYPKVDRYINEGRLIRFRNSILVDMDAHRNTVTHHEDIWVDYDRVLYRQIQRERWNVWDDCPFVNAAELCYALRKIVNSDESRIVKVMEIMEKHPSVIIFYNFDYELELLRNAYYGEGVEIAEWNGHKHQPLPEGDKWVYLVQYTAGCEGWNCITTDTIIFYSQNYSYKVMAQAEGRINRMNTPFRDLYYYHLKSKSQIDLAIGKALKQKKKFSEGNFVKW